MNVRRIMAFLLAAMLYLQPATAYATQWSAQTYFFKYWPSGWSRPDSACGQSAIYDVALNWHLTYTRSWISNSCSGSNATVGASYLASKVKGVKNGAICGETAWSWNNVNTSGWAVSAYLCWYQSHHSDLYWSMGYSTFFIGTGFDTRGPVVSPAVNYWP